MHKKFWWLAGLTLGALLSLSHPLSLGGAEGGRRRPAPAADPGADGRDQRRQGVRLGPLPGPGLSYTSEEGTILTKEKMVGDTKPFPAGISGTIKVTDFKVTVHGTVAVATHVDDEHENYHGHQLHCQYRTTDIWQKTPAGWRLIAGQVMPLRTDPPSIQLKSALLDEYVGTYALTPKILYEIRRTPKGLEGQQTGRKAEPLLAEAPDDLFVPGKVRYRRIFQRAADGHVTGFAERREAWDIVWDRLRE